MVSTYPFFAVRVGTCTTARTVRRAFQRQSRRCIVCQSTSAAPVADAQAVAGVIRVIPTRTLETALSSVYGTRIIIYMYRRVYIIISGIIHAGNKVFCNTRSGGDDRRRSYYILGWYLVYRYLCGFMGSRCPVVSFAVNWIHVYVFQPCDDNDYNSKTNCDGIFFFPPPPPGEQPLGRRGGPYVCAPDGPLTVTPRTRRIIICGRPWRHIIEVYYNKFIVACSWTRTYMV